MIWFRDGQITRNSVTTYVSTCEAMKILIKVIFLLSAKSFSYS